MSKTEAHNTKGDFSLHFVSFEMTRIFVGHERFVSFVITIE